MTQELKKKEFSLWLQILLLLPGFIYLWLASSICLPHKDATPAFLIYLLVSSEILEMVFDF